MRKRAIPAGRRRVRVAPGPRRRTYHHGNLRRALLDAALKLVEAVGPKGLTLRGAARLAGVSQAAPYRHFANKDALLAAVAEEGFQAMTAAMREAIEPLAGNPAAQLQALGIAYVGFAASHSSHFRVMFEVADRDAYPSLREAADEAFVILKGVISDCQQAGLVSLQCDACGVISDCQQARLVRADDPAEVALAAWSLAHGLSALLVDRQLVKLGQKSADELARSVTQHLLIGSAAEHSGAQAPTPAIR
jgi:AcrR family transcriptional regulator